jgi:glutaredoxin
MEYTLYIKQYCPYSQEAIQVLKKKKYKDKTYEVTNYNGTMNVVKELKKANLIPKNSKHSTVPIVFGVAGDFIGGCDKLKKVLNN